MYFTGFEIENYKGIKRAKLDLKRRNSGGNVFTLVGLNESGKTTLLEAISTFYPGLEGLEAIFPNGGGEEVVEERVPKDRKANFTGVIRVKAYLRITDNDRARIFDFCRDTLNLEIDKSSLVDFSIDRQHKFEDSNSTGMQNLWGVLYRTRPWLSRKKFTELPVGPEWQAIVEFCRKDLIPKICYFPTFLFDLPEQIYLLNPPKEHATEANEYFVKIVEDVLESIQEDLHLKRHITDRIGRAVAAASIKGLMQSEDMQQVDSVLLKIGAQLNRVIFGKWNQIFGTTITNKTIDISSNIENTKGVPSFSIGFSIRDGQSRYNVVERSLGFRWFFCFLLFTQFRTSRKGGNALFLFDEPASNLHSRAQEQLLKSFAAISSGQNMTIYSTHSHYMIEPRWLEDTFIVSNDAVNPELLPGDAESMNGVKTNIHVQRYRDFVGQQPDKMSYFQPVLDKLDYAPSRLDPLQSAVLVEGKNDFYMLSFFRELVFGGVHPFRIIPSSGANDLGPLISLYLGWGRPFVVLLDDDREGRTARDRYRAEWLLASSHVKTLGEVVGALEHKSLEATLSSEMLTQIGGGADRQPSKKEIGRFFQEHYAQKRAIMVDQQTRDTVKALLDACGASLA
jgi:energy-coupling factor transporter ATP-binding protein EcfA2